MLTQDNYIKGRRNNAIIAFDVGRTLPNMDLSRDFMELVVDGSMDLGTHIFYTPQIFLQGWMTSQRERAWDRDWPGLVW